MRSFVAKRRRLQLRHVRSQRTVCRRYGHQPHQPGSQSLPTSAIGSASRASARGFAVGAVKLTAAFAFETLGLMRIEIVAAADNAGSRRVAEKAGALFECLARNRLLIHGKPVTAAVYSLIPKRDDPSPVRRARRVCSKRGAFMNRNLIAVLGAIAGIRRGAGEGSTSRSSPPQRAFPRQRARHDRRGARDRVRAGLRGDRVRRQPVGATTSG